MVPGMSDIWYVDIAGDDLYSNPVNLGPGINTEARESFPFISDENNMYFSSDGRGGLGGFDVFTTALDQNGIPTKISNLGAPTNSGQDDFGFIINEDKRMGYLSSNRDGQGGSVSDEIYLIREKCEAVISGVVYDKNTGEILPGATVLLLDADNNRIGATISDANGAYSFSESPSCESQYALRGTKDDDGYEPDEKIATTGDSSGTKLVDLYLTPPECAPNDLGCRLSLEPIYFDFDRYNIRPDAAIELAKILAAMREYPQLIIHIESHTDSRGNDSYNEALSEKRAQSTLAWLVDQGISRERLSAKGYGEYQLTNECSNGADCTEEEHQLNRRSMFIIQN